MSLVNTVRLYNQPDELKDIDQLPRMNTWSAGREESRNLFIHQDVQCSTTPLLIREDGTPIAFDEIDVLSCTNEELLKLLDAIRELISGSSELESMKKKQGKNVTKQKMAVMQEKLLLYKSSLERGKAVLNRLLKDVNDSLSRTRRGEMLLHEYYQTLDEDIKRGDKEWLPRDDDYHDKQRRVRRTVPCQRYSANRMFLEARREKLHEIWKEIEMKESAFDLDLLHSASVAPTAELNNNYGLNNSKEMKLEMYGASTGGIDGVSGNDNPESRMLMHQLVQNMRSAYISSPAPHSVQSRLRKLLILPFSARVLALKIDDGNNAGERFVEWYVNKVIDPLAMAQLVELVPREYLVTTTVRLMNACDSLVDLKQARALPDVLHVILEAIAAGRSDAFASLVLSPSTSYLRALENQEHVGIIFFAALITGQMEVLRHLMYFGFYNINALIVWLFLNPNSADSGYATHVTNVRASFKMGKRKETRIMRDDFEECNYLDGLTEMKQSSLNMPLSADEKLLPINGMCGVLRRFLSSRMMLKENNSANLSPPLSTTTMPQRSQTRASYCDERPQRLSSTCLSLPHILPPAQRTPSRLGTSHSLQECTSTEVSFSSLLDKRQLEVLQLLPVKCAVLPAVSTSFIRRADAWGYTPLKATKSHFFLVGDTSTQNAHVVRLPPQHMDMWPDDDMTETSHVRRQRVRRQTTQKQQGLAFYYEAHISLRFLLSDVPLTDEVFNATRYEDLGSFCTAENVLPPLQSSTVFVGWCSEERVAAADGLTSQPPLGSDCHSIGISFDVLHRAKINRFTEEVILQPRKHAMGRNTAYASVGKTSREVGGLKEENKSEERTGESSPLLLLRLRIGDTHKSTENDGIKASPPDPFLLSEQEALPEFQSPLTSVDSGSLTVKSGVKESIVPAVELMELRGNNSTIKSSNKEDEQWATAFAESAVVLSGTPVYNVHTLVVGCHVDFGTQRASFTVNGKSLGTAFTVLPSTVTLRPAISLQSSNQTAEFLQRINPADAVIVRFVFDEAYMLNNHKAADKFFTLERSHTSHDHEVENTQEKKEEQEDCCKPIPGVFSISSPLLFDRSMADCAFFRLITCAESSLLAGDNDSELLQSDGKTLSLGPTLKLTPMRIRQLLNARSSGEVMLFFPPVFVRRRSDHVMSDTNRVAIIPEDISLTPLCVALTQRQRIPAYHIASHVFTDFDNTDKNSIQQRRMALLGAAALGYVEVLYILLERLFVSEVLAVFALTVSKNHSDFFLTGKKIRVFSSDSCRKISSVTSQNLVEYTPLHCAILEGHHQCVHLLLYYLNRVLPEEYKKHAVNVLTRSGESALLMACRLGYTKVAKRLLAIGASPSAFDRVTRTNCLELACASCSEEIAMALLQTSDYHSSVTVNLAGVASPICWCALNNIGSLIRPLIMNGADLNVTLDGLTPLLLAVTFGSTEAALQILQCSSSATSVVHSSTSCPQESKVVVGDSFKDTEEKSLATIDVDTLDPLTQCSALHLACELGQLDVATALIEKGASLNLQNKAKYVNPLQVAILNDNEKIALELLEYAKVKLRRGFNVLDISAIDKGGNTALHLAAQMGMLPVIEYIMLQFSDEEITRLSGIRTFVKRPNPVSLTATNRQGRTPLLAGIYAHQEAAAQLIASLMPESFPNPGGPVVNGTCMAVLASDSEGLDNLTLFFLSQPRYVVKETFREDFFARYNAKRRQMDLNEDGAAGEEDKKSYGTPSQGKKRVQMSSASHRSRESRHRGRDRQKSSHISSALMSRTALSPGLYAEKLCSVTGAKRSSLVRLRNISKKHSGATTQRRCSTFMQLLLARRETGLVTRTSVQVLEKGFPIEELCAMVSIICSESTQRSQSVNAMLYSETIISFLREYGDLYIASKDAVAFVKQLYWNSRLTEFLEGDHLEEAKRRLLEMRPLCKELLYIIRTRERHEKCVEDMRHMITQRGDAGFSTAEELSSSFGITVFQVAATLGLSHVCDFFLNECGLDPLYVPHESRHFCSASKWLLTPFRLALRSVSLDTVAVFLSPETSSDSLYRLLEHRELLKADSLQRTALQEVTCRPLDTSTSGNSTDILHLMRFLIQSGAVLQGNFDANGEDAWMLAVCASPGKGTQLKLFLEEKAPFDNEVDSSDTKKTLTDVDSEQQKEDGEIGWTASQPGDEGQSYASCSMLPLRSLTGTFRDELDVFKVDTSSVRSLSSNQEMYYAQLIFLCAEHNPQCLVSLLGQYPEVLSPSATHPLTGDTLLLFLLRKAANIYFEECGHNVLLTLEANKESTVHLTPHTFLESETTKTTDIETMTYRDPLTVPSVRLLLLVVEHLLRRFHFTNLYYICKDGHTALLFAACLSCTTIVSLILGQGASQYEGDVYSSNSKEENVSIDTRSGTKTVTSGKCAINTQLVKNLESYDCWKMLASRLYYAEGELETLLIIVNHLVETSVKYSFLSMVFSNLHPILSLQVAVLYTKDVKRILMHPEAVNAFWSNVLYAQYVGRFEEVTATSAQWSSLLSVLLPTASAVPIYLIKTTPSLPLSSESDLLPVTLKSSYLPDPTYSSIKVMEKKKNPIMPNWKAILTRIKQYVRQIAAAAVCTASPATAIAAAHGGGVIPSSQRHVLAAMTTHFHELIELSVRFDNCALLKDLMNLTPEELKNCIKYEWRNLMEKCNIDVIAIAAGSTGILRFLVDNPETSTHMYMNRYDRIDPASGLSEDASMTDEANMESSHALQQSASYKLNSPKRGVGRNSISTVHQSSKSANKTSSVPESKVGTKKSTENKQALVNLLLLDTSTGVTNTENPLNDTESPESRLNCIDMMTAARERPTVSAVTWGIGAAARPIDLQGNSKTVANTSTLTQHNLPLEQVHKIRGKTGFETSLQLRTPRSNEEKLSVASGRPKFSAVEVVQKSVSLASRVTMTVDQSEPPRYFAFYLCDWALHTTLLLHAPRPSSKTIDTLLYLMDQRAPLTAAVLHIFLAASRPLNNWVSSDGRLLTLNYTTRTNKDTLLHLLVQNNQLQLARYFLAAALCYFTHYRYDPPTTIPPQFALFDMPQSPNQVEPSEPLGKVECDETELTGDNGMYPAVFLRSMVRINKHGLTAFDYAHGPMVSLLMEYGCMSPSYRPNPRGFCRAIRLTTNPSAFQAVPRLLLVSSNFLKLHDDGGVKHSKPPSSSFSKVVADALLIRNQAVSQRITRTEVLPSLLTDNVSLLHLGLCSADDELVLHNINEKRRKQMKTLMKTQASRVATMPPLVKNISSPLVGPQRLKKHDLLRMTPTLSTPSLQSSHSLGKNEEETHSLLKLLDALHERGFVTVPLVLNLDQETGQPLDDGGVEEDTAILISMTFMTLAQCAGAVQREERPQSKSSPRRQKARNFPDHRFNDTISVPPRFRPGMDGTVHSAEVLESWVASRRTKKQNGSGKDPHMQLLVKAVGGGVAGRIVRVLGLSTAPSYELLLQHRMSGETTGKNRANRGTAASTTNTVDHSNVNVRKRPRVACLRQDFSRQLYQMIIRQLHHDGFLAAAAAVADATNVVVPRLEMNGQRLSRLVARGLAHEASSVMDMDNFTKFEVVERYLGASKLYVPLHLSENATVGHMAYRMRERFTTPSLGGVVRCVGISPDGSLVACGGTNGLCVVFSLNTIEDLMALEEVRQENHFRGLDGSSGGGGGLGMGVRNASNKITELAEARRFHEHTQSVEVMQFHPSRPLLLTGGREGDLYVRDYSQPDNKVVHKLHDTYPIRSGVFHPSGEYVLYATDHTALRLLNLRTGKLMTPTIQSSGQGSVTASNTTVTSSTTSIRGGAFRRGNYEGHTAALCDVAFSSDGNLFASCGLDGSLIVYDGVSGRAVAKVTNAHSSVPVTSVVFSRTRNFLLTSGMDSVARLWDLRRSDGSCGSAEVMSFGEPGKCNHRSIHAAFSCNESHVLCQDTSLFAIHAHCVYTGDTSYSLVVPNHMQRGFAAAPFYNAVVSGGDDCRVRLWTPAWATP